MKTEKTSLALWQERLLERGDQCSCSIVSDMREQRALIPADLFCRRCRQCYSNQIMEQLKGCEQVLLPLL